MAEHDSTLRTRFAQIKFKSNFQGNSQSNFVVKTNFIQPPVSLHDTPTSLNVLINGPVNGFSTVSLPMLTVSSLSNENFPTTMETLRSYVNYLLSLPLPVAVKNRLRLKYWAVECRLEAVCLLLDEAHEKEGVEDDALLGEVGINPSYLDLSELNFFGVYFSSPNVSAN